jgi:hypothetical protein
MAEADDRASRYVGYRTGDGVSVRKEGQDGRMVPLPMRNDLRNHSPTGPEWGYGGSGPAQLALAILSDAIGERAALDSYQDFKFAVVSGLPHGQWELHRSEVLAWHERYRQPERPPSPGEIAMDFDGPEPPGHASAQERPVQAGDGGKADEMPSRPGETPLDRAERQLREWKEANGGLGMEFEAGKLHVLEQDIDWTGVGDLDKQRFLAREIDFSGITRNQLNSVYEEIGSDEIDERPGRRLFDVANYERAVTEAKRIPFGEQMAQVRDTTRNLVESIMLDGRPRAGAIVDFGLDSQRHYEALYHAIRNGEVAPLVLDAAMGHGAKLTLLARESPSNSHKDIQFHTAWDELLGRPLAAAKDRPLSPGDIANRKDAPEPPGHGPEQERER